MHIVSDISNDTKPDNSRELSNIWIYYRTGAKVDIV